jgi:hypothetical protein
VFLGSRSTIGAAIAVAVALTAGLEAPAFAAPTKQECFSSSQSGQELQRAGKLRDARAEFITCSSASCPAMVRADCAQHVDEVNRAIPSVVVEATDGDGNDLGAVKVAVDGAPLLERLDGRPVEVDPGEHKFTFAYAGRAPIEKSFLIREGEKGRHERIVFAASKPIAAAAPASAAAPAPAPASAPPPTVRAPPPSPPPVASASPASTQRIVSFALAGAGVVGIGVGSAFGLMASSSYNQARTDCGTGCSATSKARSEKSTADGDATVSTVSFIAGGAALAAGVVLFFTAPNGREGKAPPVSVLPGIGPSSASLLLTGRF